MTDPRPATTGGMSADRRLAEAFRDMEGALRDAVLFARTQARLVEDTFSNRKDDRYQLSSEQADVLSFIAYQTQGALTALVREWDAAHDAAFPTQED